jgi:hypothetical protein
MSTPLIIGLMLGSLVALIAMLAVSRLVLRMMVGSLEDRIAAHYGPDEILMRDLTANSFGLQSAGVWQVRGNGAMVLTAECLHFFMFLPRRELRVPLDAITELTFTRSHLGKATIFDLLKVRFNSEGKSDSIAWYLADPAAWKQKIEELGRGVTHGRQ